uniref:Transposase n=1 Tax=Panagrellus redivivus TaxID=6233 RepID=A0A7E4VKN7_PANRE
MFISDECAIDPEAVGTISLGEHCVPIMKATNARTVLRTLHFVCWFLFFFKTGQSFRRGAKSRNFCAGFSELANRVLP